MVPVLGLSFKDRDYWPTRWKITMKCIESCPLNSVCVLECICLCMCANAFKHVYIHDVVCVILLGLCPPSIVAVCDPTASRQIEVK